MLRGDIPDSLELLYTPRAGTFGRCLQDLGRPIGSPQIADSTYPQKAPLLIHYPDLISVINRRLIPVWLTSFPGSARISCPYLQGDVIECCRGPRMCRPPCAGERRPYHDI